MNTSKTEGIRRLDHQINTFMYFTRIHSHFHLSMFNAVLWHFEWIVSSCNRMILKVCRMFLNFVYNIWICQCHFFTWTYQPIIYISINILALPHIEPMFLFWTPENFKNFMVFWIFQTVKNETLVLFGLTTYLSLVSHRKPVHYFLPPDYFRKLRIFQKFSRGKM